MVTITQLFIHFLKQNNAYEKYIYNFENIRQHNKKYSTLTFKKITSCTDKITYINDAFIWNNTNEGWLYWCKLHKDWMKL